jgi:hypothetical protein
VSAHEGRVIPQPEVFAIYWGSYFTSNPGAVDLMNQFLTDLVTGPYLNGMRQYGVSAGSLAGSVVIDLAAYPAPVQLKPSAAQSQLIAWLDAGVVSAKPAGNERNKVYMIFPPAETQLVNEDGSTNGFCGYHRHGKYNSSSNDDNLFWGIVVGAAFPDDPRGFVDFLSKCVSHELAETFSNPDNRGYFAGDCEIGDLCEMNANGDWLFGAPAVIAAGDAFRDVYVRGQDGAVYHKYWNGQQWNGWYGLGGQIVGAPAVVNVRAGLTDIYVRGTDDRLYQKWWDGQKWNPSDDGWDRHDDGDFRLGSAPAVVAAGDAFRDIYVRGQDGAVYHKYWDGQLWSGWQSISGGIVGAPGVAGVRPGFTDIYVRGLDDRLYQRWWDGQRWGPAGGWLQHDDGDFRLGSEPAPVAVGDDFRDVYVRGQDGLVYHKYWDAQSGPP